MMNQDLKEKLFAHIAANVQDKKIILDTINGTMDHIHALILLKPDQSLSKVIQLIKGESSYWVNKNKITRFHFEWQDEYIALSVSESAIAVVRDYIANQEIHHRKKGFAEEYEEFMKIHGLKPE
jgi:putative transposase